MNTRANRELPLLFALLAGTLSGQQGQSMEVQPNEYEVYVDSVNGSDVAGLGTAQQPYRTVTQYLDQVAPLEAHDGDILFFDADGDGDKDLIRHNDYQGWWPSSPARNRYFRNDSVHGRVEFTYLGDVGIDPVVWGFSPVDLDLDGDEDFIILEDVYAGGSWNFLTLYNLGGSPPVFQKGPELLSNGAPISQQGFGGRFRVGDVNGDGIWDLVVSGPGWNGILPPPIECPNTRIPCSQLFVWLHTGNATGLDFTAPMPLPGPTGSLVFPFLGGESVLFADSDGDGDDDLFLCDGQRLFFCEQLAPMQFGPRLILLDLSNIPRTFVGLAGAWDKFGDGKLWLLLMDERAPGILYYASTAWSYHSMVEVTWHNGAPQLGERYPLTLTGTPGQPVATRVHLAPGTYSAASGEVFPWNLARGGHFVGAGRSRTIIDGNGEETIRFRHRNNENFAPLTANELQLHLSDLEVRHGAPALWVWRFAEGSIERVRLANSDRGVHQGVLQAIIDERRGHLVYRDVEFVGNYIGADLSESFMAETYFDRCRFENNTRGGVIANDGGRVDFTACRFVAHPDAAIELFSSAACSSTPCPESETLRSEIVGCVFDANAEHLRVLSALPTTSNIRVRLWNSTFSGMGTSLATAPTGVDHAVVDVRNAILWSGTPAIHSNFANLTVARSSLADPAWVGTNGNVTLAPDFALSSEDGHLLASSPLRGRGDPSILSLRRTDLDGESIARDHLPDIGADEVAVPALFGRALAPPGSTHAVHVVGHPAGLALLLLGTDLITGPRLGTQRLHVDPAASSTIAFPVALDARGVATLNSPVPNDPRFAGLRFYAQALAFHAPAGSPSTFELTPFLLFQVN